MLKFRPTNLVLSLCIAFNAGDMLNVAYAQDANKKTGASTIQAVVKANTVQANAVQNQPISSQAVSNQDINDLIILAINTHPLVGAAEAEALAASEGVRAAKMGFLPTPSISTSLNDDDLVTQLNIRQPLWTGGRLTANFNQAVYDERAAQMHIWEQKNTIAKNTIDIWQSYLHAKELQTLLLQDLQKLIEFEKMMNRRVSAGVSARIELDLVTNRILQEHNRYQAAKEQERIALARLSQTIGNADITPTSTLSEHLQIIKNQAANLEPLVLNAQSANHPSIVKQANQVLAAEASVDAKKASRYPSIYAQYQYQYREKGSNNSDLSIGLNYDLESGLSNLALVDAADHRVNSLRQSQEATSRTIAENITTQYQQFVSAKDQQKSLETAVTGGGLVLKSYERQFIAGRKNWLDVLNAAREESQYKQQLLQTQIQMVAAFYKLQIDLGQMPWQNYDFDAPIAVFSLSETIDSAIFSIIPSLDPASKASELSQQTPKETSLNQPLSQPLSSQPLSNEQQNEKPLIDDTLAPDSVSFDSQNPNTDTDL